MKVREGDRVVLGQPLFEDKKNPGVIYTSPGTGVVKEVNRGHRRVFESCVIELEASDEATAFESMGEAGLVELDSDKAESQLLASGLWTSLRTRPFNKVPVPGSRPASVFVTAMDTHPLAADPAVVIAERKGDFEAGLRVLSKFAGRLFVCKAPGADIPAAVGQAREFAGPHPAGLPGTHIHFLDPVHQHKTVWFVNYQDVIAIGCLFLTGTLDVGRVVAIGGPGASNPRLVRTRIGASLADLMRSEATEGEQRVISGSVFGGRTAKGPFGYLGRYHLQVSVLAEGRERPFLHYLTLGANRFSVINTYLSSLSKGKLFNFTTSCNGSERAMVPMAAYEKVMPLEVLPTQLLRALIVGDGDTAQKLGCLELDEDDVALCTFVCPSKYEYGPILRDNLTRIEKEG
jgi:Na+-transporting NADH:ubiquinone oxidoreductase subunit A